MTISDGSAFITKAECSNERNILSNRIAQLENSLDSKIDSLVSACLCRNNPLDKLNIYIKVLFFWNIIITLLLLILFICK